MSIQEKLREDHERAMRSKDKPTLNAIRSVQAEVATAKSAPGFHGEVDDDLYRKTIATYVKRISKARSEYLALGERGEDHAATLSFEIEYLEGFLPKTLDETATRALVEHAIADLGADAETPAGKVIGAVMRSGETLDGGLVNLLVRELLGQLSS